MSMQMMLITLTILSARDMHWRAVRVASFCAHSAYFAFYTGRSSATLERMETESSNLTASDSFVDCLIIFIVL